MKKVLVLLMVLMFCMACAMATVETKGKDAVGGATCKATYTSAFKSLTEVKMTACGAGGEAGASTIDPATSVLMKIVIDALAAKAAPAAVVTPGVITK